MVKRGVVKESVAKGGVIDGCEDRRWMRAAVLQSRYALGQTAPNPAVGCVIVRDGRLVGRGFTGAGGRPHAETEAIEDAREDARDLCRGGVAYVTLEPCSHTGATRPCAEALIDAGVERVVIGVLDPDLRVAGRGRAMLEDAGVSVTLGVLAAECRSVLAGYLLARGLKRPMVTVKIASSLDGRIGLGDGRSQWITGASARGYVHVLRSQHDAILTGMGTVRADDPSLTCRLSGYSGRQPRRVLVASRDDLSPSSKLAQARDGVATWLYVVRGGAAQKRSYERIVISGDDEGCPDMSLVLADLGERGVVSVLVEAGGRLLASLMKAGVIDRVIWMRSPQIIGGDGIASIGELGLGELAEGRIFKRVESFELDDDHVDILERKNI